MDEFKFKYEQHYNWIKWVYGKHPRDPRQDKFHDKHEISLTRLLSAYDFFDNEMISRETQDFYLGGFVSDNTDTVNGLSDQACDNPDDIVTEVNNWDECDLEGSEWYNNQWSDW